MEYIGLHVHILVKKRTEERPRHGLSRNKRLCDMVYNVAWNFQSCWAPSRDHCYEFFEHNTLLETDSSYGFKYKCSKDYTWLCAAYLELETRQYFPVTDVTASKKIKTFHKHQFIASKDNVLKVLKKNTLYHTHAAATDFMNTVMNLQIS
jgi:hypothetical protein